MLNRRNFLVRVTSAAASIPFVGPALANRMTAVPGGVPFHCFPSGHSSGGHFYRRIIGCESGARIEGAIFEECQFVFGKRQVALTYCKFVRCEPLDLRMNADSYCSDSVFDACGMRWSVNGGVASAGLPIG